MGVPLYRWLIYHGKPQSKMDDDYNVGPPNDS